jgi:hypothetical protein
MPTTHHQSDADTPEPVARIADKLDEMTVNEETSERDAGYMAAVREIREWLAEHPSKAHPDSRDRGIGFRIGDAFPADDPVARWVTVLAMAANQTIYLKVRVIEGDLPAEVDSYYVRLMASHLLEVAQWITDACKHSPEIDEFIQSLDEEALGLCDRIGAYASQKHDLNETLLRCRNTLFHYPEIHPDKQRAGQEEIANALIEVKDLPGWFEQGDIFATFRATFADEIAARFISDDSDGVALLEQELEDPMIELVVFAEKVILAYLMKLPRETTVLWRPGTPKPTI